MPIADLLKYAGRFNGFDVWVTIDDFLYAAWHIANPVIEKMQWETPWEKIPDYDRFWDRYMQKYEAEEWKAKIAWARS